MKNQYHRSIFVFMLSLLQYFPSFSNVGFENALRISMDNGLSNNCVFNTVQDHIGLIWTATEWGLNRFDGTSFRKYYANNADSSSLCNSIVQALYADTKQQELWIGTDNGINRYDYEKDNFRRYYYYDKNGNQNLGDIVDIIPQGRDRLWVCSFYGGLLSFDKRKGTFRWVKEVCNLIRKDNGTIHATALFDDGNGSVWIGTNGNGVIRYIPKEGRAERHSLFLLEQDRAHFAGNVRRFYLDAQNILWVTTSGGLFYRRLSDSDSGFRQVALLKNTSLYDLKMIRNSIIWIGGEKGIYKLLKDDLTPANRIIPTFYSFFFTAKNDISLQSVRNIYEDKYTNIWLSSYTGGVVFLPGIPSLFQTLLLRSSTESVIRNIKPLCIGENFHGEFLVGTDGDGIFAVDSNYWVKAHYKLGDDQHALLNIVQTLCCTPDRILWVGTYEGGVVRYDMKSGQSRIYNTLNSDLTGNDVRVIKQSRDRLWVGAKYGLTLFDLSGKLLKAYRTGENGLNGDDIRQIEVLPDGNLWMVLYNGGIAYFDTANETFQVYRNEPGNPLSLPSNTVTDIHCSREGRLWVATREYGVFYFKEGGGVRLGKHQIEQPLLRLFEDQNQNLWLCTMNNIQRFNLSTQTVDSYMDENIKQVDMFYGSIGLQAENGRIYFGGSNGIISFNPKKVTESIRSTFKPIFTDFQLFNTSLPISTPAHRTPLRANILTAPDLVLSHDQSVFSIHYTVADYGYGNSISYAYILEGEDKQWDYVGNRTFAEYRNLSPGQYRFKVKASNPDGVWSDEVAEINIRITPPFWKTPMMYILYLVAFIFLLYISFRALTYRMQTLNRLRRAGRSGELETTKPRSWS